MTKLVSVRVASLREKFRQFEHEGQWLGSDEIAGLISELRSIGVAAAALEDQVAGQHRVQIPHSPLPPQRPPLPHRRPPGVLLGTVPLGTVVFVPHDAKAGA